MSDTRDEGTERPKWKLGEEGLRRQEVELQGDGVRLQRKGTRAQLSTAIAALVAASVALWIAFNAREAIDVAKHSVESQAEENRIATAVGGIRSDGPVAQRIAAFELLQRQAVQKLERANGADATDAERRDALNFFRSTLKTLEGYVRDPVGFTKPDPWGVGNAEPPRDVHTVGVDIQRMLRYRTLFYDVRGERGDLSILDRELPHLDLSFTSLYGVGVGPIDMSWLRPGYFPSIDLRHAVLAGSKWQGTNLAGAYLRCATLYEGHPLEGRPLATNMSHADLTEADMRRADLRNADLRNAVLERAHLEGANLEGAKFKRAQVAGAHFNGAILDSGALRNARDSERATGVGDPEEPPASEGQVEPECDAHWWPK
jgi:hypothetical protein